jgi:putative oxidoreductase
MALAVVVRILLSLLFAYAGVIKIIDPQGMKESIEAYRIIDGVWALIAAYLLPWVELWAALGLWWRRTAKGASLLLIAMMIVFIIALGSAAWRGISLACGCFGTPEPGEISDYRVIMARDAMILLLAIYTFRSSPLPERC